MNRLITITVLVGIVSGCVATKHHPPQITDVSNADSLVRVSIFNARTGGIMGMLWPPDHEIQAKGEEGCQIFGKPAVRLGSKCMEYWQPDNKLFCKTAEILFACKTAE